MEKDLKRQTAILADEYLAPFHAFAISRTNNAHEADELAQEITYQCVAALHRSGTVGGLNAYLWSIAHNTYKRWLYKKRNGNYLSLDDNMDFAGNIIDSSPRANIEDTLMKSEDMRLLRKELSLMTNFYRKALVLFYFDELSIAEISKRLGVSVEMVKFYLQRGRKKLKEAYIMSQEYKKSSALYGEKSFNPSPFTVFRGTYDFCSVNVWEIFKRKLPCQIALICYDSPKTADEICLETGTPAAYIEDEINILFESELLISPVKDKYQTNFFILRKNALGQLKDQFEKMYSKYIPFVIETYEKYITEMKECGIFTFDAEDKRYAWFYEDKVIDFAGSDINMSEDDAMTLADGAKGLIYAQEETGIANAKNHCSIYLEKCGVKIHASGIGRNYQRLENELIHEVRKDGEQKISALYDIYKGNPKDSDAEIYAQLIEQGYAFKKNGKLFCNIAFHTDKSKSLFEKINAELELVLIPLCKEIHENISKIVASTIPPQLKQYAHGYTAYEISFYAGIYFREALYNKGFMTIPEDSDKTPVSCWIQNAL